MGFLSLSLDTQPTLLAHTALIQKILTDSCQLLLCSAHSAHIVQNTAHSADIVQNTYRYMHILADS